MRDKHDALKDAVAEVHRAHQLVNDEEQKDHLDRALLLLSLVQALEEADGQCQETIRTAIEHSSSASSD